MEVQFTSYNITQLYCIIVTSASTPYLATTLDVPLSTVLCPSHSISLDEKVTKITGEK